MNGCLAVGRLPDGRYQGWMYESGNNKLYTFIQSSPDPQTIPTLSEFPMPTPLSGSAYDTYFYVYPDALNGLAVTALPDGRLQLWIAGSYGIFTCVMLSTDANSKWSVWRQLTDPPVPVPWVQSLKLAQQYQKYQFNAGIVAQSQVLKP